MTKTIMAKTIKFNLICDGNPVRTIEDLQNNFSIEDVLEYYNNQLLHRWLEVRGYSDEFEKVKAISVKKPIEIIKELIKIFNVVSDEKKVKESVYMLEFKGEREFLLDEYQKMNYKVDNIIDDYQSGYRQLVDGILENPDDVAKIKANIAENPSKYAWIFQLNHRNLFWILINESVLAIMCLLMNSKSRDYYLPIKKEPLEENSEYVEMSYDKKNMYKKICELIQTADFKEKVGENMMSFAGETDGYWKDLEPKGKKFMILSMDSGNYIRSAGLSDGDLECYDVQNRFLILDGIDYKSNYSNDTLLYMEV